MQKAPAPTAQRPHRGVRSKGRCGWDARACTGHAEARSAPRSVGAIRRIRGALNAIRSDPRPLGSGPNAQSHGSPQASHTRARRSPPLPAPAARSARLRARQSAYCRRGSSPERTEHEDVTLAVPIVQPPSIACAYRRAPRVSLRCGARAWLERACVRERPTAGVPGVAGGTRARARGGRFISPREIISGPRALPCARVRAARRALSSGGAAHASSAAGPCAIRVRPQESQAPLRDGGWAGGF